MLLAKSRMDSRSTQP